MKAHRKNKWEQMSTLLSNIEDPINKNKGFQITRRSETSREEFAQLKGVIERLGRKVEFLNLNKVLVSARWDYLPSEAETLILKFLGRQMAKAIWEESE